MSENSLVFFFSFIFLQYKTILQLYCIWRVIKFQQEEQQESNLRQRSCVCPCPEWFQGVVSRVCLHHGAPLFRHGAAAAVIFISPIKNHIFFFTIFFLFTPFHPVIETSAFALISRPETAEGVNQCPITRAKEVKGEEDEESVVCVCVWGGWGVVQG